MIETPSARRNETPPTTGRRLLVTDLDGTLVGDPAALDRFAAWLEPRRDEFVLVFATGRRWNAVDRAVRASELPRPDAVISAVGTEIHRWDGSPWPAWHEQFERSHGVRARQALASFPWLEPQPGEQQSDFKASYFVDDRAMVAELEVHDRLLAAGLAAKLVFSAEHYLDVIPAGAGKGQAARFVARALAIPASHVLAFGDSGNDRELLLAGFAGTVVANALPELTSLSGPRVYHSPQPFADGILDGIRHWTE